MTNMLTQLVAERGVKTLTREVEVLRDQLRDGRTYAKELEDKVQELESKNQALAKDRKFWMKLSRILMDGREPTEEEIRRASE